VSEAPTEDIDFRQISASIGELYADTQRCAAVAGLVYISGAEPGIRRRRHGRGFGYRDAENRPLTDEAVKARILNLAIPPAWKNVWICPDEDGHILAVGEDDRGRKQYIYHERWRELRDLLNFYRLITFAEQLPTIREHVERQLRRRTMDRDQVLAAMVRIIDSSAMRIGNEVYAEENDTFGLSTLTKRHVQVERGTIRFRFPAKSHREAALTVHDPAVARVVTKLTQHRRRRVFTVAGRPIESTEVNELLLELSGAHVTAKDFRTWRGTLTAFSYLTEHADTDRDRDQVAIEAVDAAADALGNTRAVARAHYVHPHVLRTFTEDRFREYLKMSIPEPLSYLHAQERSLLAFLGILLEREFNQPEAVA
jgi:DNA topoisomerase-1